MDCEKLGRVTQGLTMQEVGDQMLHGKIEAYSCESFSKPMFSPTCLPLIGVVVYWELL